MPMEDEYYSLLGLTEDATEKEIKKAYYVKALIYHPDKQTNKNNPEAAAMFIKVSKAHEVLMDKDKKAAYDSTIKAQKMKKRKESEMDSSRKKMKEDLDRREKEGLQKREERRATRTAKYTDDDTSWLKKDKPFKMPAQPTMPTEDETQKTTVVAKWSRKITRTRDEVMEAFKRFGDIDLVMLKDIRDSGKGRPSALISFKNAGSAQAAVKAKVDGYKVRMSLKPPSSTPPPQQASTPQQSYLTNFQDENIKFYIVNLTHRIPYSFASPLGTPYPYSPAGSPFTFTSPQGGAFFSPSQPTRSVGELEDFEMQILNKMKKAAQAQKDATPISTPTSTPSSTPSATPQPSTPTPTSPFTTPLPTPSSTPIKSFPSFSPLPSPSPNRGASTPIDADNPTATSPINVDDPLNSSAPIIDVDSPHKANGTTSHSINNGVPFGSSLDFESVTMMNMRRAAERKRIMEELEKGSSVN